MSKDVIDDRYARLYEMPRQLALLGHDVLGICLGYQRQPAGSWTHETERGRLRWVSRSLGRTVVLGLIEHLATTLGELRGFEPDVIIGASDIPHIVMAAWLSGQLDVPWAADLYDNFEGFGQGKIPGFVLALRAATRSADLVTTTSEPLRKMVLDVYGATGAVISLPSAVDKEVFRQRNKAASRKSLGLPEHGRLIGTAGGLYRDKGVRPLYAAWHLLAERRSDLHLVLAGPHEGALAPPKGDRVHYLGELNHNRVAELFAALDVGVISVLDTTFGRYCFPQKAYEMLACKLPVAAADVGAMASLFESLPHARYEAGNAEQLADAIEFQLTARALPRVEVDDWKAFAGRLEPALLAIAQGPRQQ